MPKSNQELVQIVSYGGGVIIDGATKSTPEIVQIACMRQVLMQQ
jgi:hypothetical protein